MNLYDVYDQAEFIAAQFEELGYNTEANSIREAIKYSSLSSEILVKIRFALSGMKNRIGLPIGLASEIRKIIDDINEMMGQ